MAGRRDRGDQTVEGHERKHGLKRGTLRNPDGRKTRKDKLLKTIRKEAKKGSRKKKA